MPLLKVENLRKDYRGRVVVNGIGFEVQKGEIVGLLGQNGAGKTTAFRMTIGMIPSDGGQVYFQGKDIGRLPMYQRARRGMGYLSQEPSVFQRLTVRANVLAILEMLRISRKERKRRLNELLNSLGLTKLAKSKASTLSGGERRRLEITRALATSPKLILLDEPFSGVDPIAVGEIKDIILGLKDTGIGILLTDHNVHDTLSVTDRSYIICEGRIEASGTPEQLLNDARARKLYLGEQIQIEHIPRARPRAGRTESDKGTTEAGPSESPAEPPELK